MDDFLLPCLARDALFFFKATIFLFSFKLCFNTLKLAFAIFLNKIHFYLFSLAAFHHVSVYPKKELPFFIHFTAGLCSSTAMIALLTHQFPEIMGVFAKAVSMISRTCIEYL